MARPVKGAVSVILGSAGGQSIQTLAHEAVHAATCIVPADTTDSEALPRAVDQLVSAVLERYHDPDDQM